MTDLDKVVKDFKRTNDKSLLKGLTEVQLKIVVQQCVDGSGAIKAAAFASYKNFL